MRTIMTAILLKMVYLLFNLDVIQFYIGHVIEFNGNFKLD